MKGCIMSEKIISYTQNTLTTRTLKERARLKVAMERSETDIDTSDIPEWTAEDFLRAERGKFYRPVKAQITAKVDMDVLNWLKSQGPGYQSRMNAILRREMLQVIASGVQLK
jgi:uncharacterized protein (DUF4415 family)